MSSKEHELSFREKLDVARVIGSTAFLAFCTAIRHFVLPPPDSEGVKKTVSLLILRTLGTKLSAKQRDAYDSHLPSTGEGIDAYCSKNNIIHVIEKLPHGAILHWVGPRSTSSDGKVLLYFHGGGYQKALHPNGHVKFSLRLAEAGSASLAMLEYTLTPIGRYPTQLQQASAALKHLLETTSPAQITVAGDSAGGHLATGLLSHLIHPSSSIEPLPLSEKLGGLALISPFPSLDYEESYTSNAKYDYLTRNMVEDFNSLFLPPGLSNEEAIKDPQISPADAPGGWWKDSPVSRLLLVYGTREIFRDGCAMFGARMKSECAPDTRVDVARCEGEVHVACIVDQAIGVQDRDMAKALLEWMRASSSPT